MSGQHTPGTRAAAEDIFQRWIYNIGYDRKQTMKDGSQKTIGEQTISMIKAIIDQQTATPEQQARIESLEAEKAELVDILKRLDKWVQSRPTELEFGGSEIIEDTRAAITQADTVETDNLKPEE